MFVVVRGDACSLLHTSFCCEKHLVAKKKPGQIVSKPLFSIAQQLYLSICACFNLVLSCKSHSWMGKAVFRCTVNRQPVIAAGVYCSPSLSLLSIRFPLISGILLCCLVTPKKNIYIHQIHYTLGPSPESSHNIKGANYRQQISNVQDRWRMGEAIFSSFLTSPFSFIFFFNSKSINNGTLCSTVDIIWTEWRMEMYCSL